MKSMLMRRSLQQRHFINSKLDEFRFSTEFFYSFKILSRLINAYAEEAAVEDAIYYLGEALRSGVIDLETFLKQVRQLARKQFMLRALMQKCRQRAGLAG